MVHLENMRALLVFVPLLSLAFGAAISNPDGLSSDFQEFVALVPLGDVLSLANRYFEKDGEVFEFFRYLNGEEFAVVWDRFFALDLVLDLLAYLDAAGVSAYDWIDSVAEFIGQKRIQSKRIRTVVNGGMLNFAEELFEILPLKEMKDLYDEKMQSSAEFKAFFAKLRNADYVQLHQFYRDSAEFRSFIQRFRAYGFDVELIEHEIWQFLGWKTHGRT